MTHEELVKESTKLIWQPSAICKNCMENLVKKIKQLEPLNNTDCPEWVINIIKGEING